MLIMQFYDKNRNSREHEMYWCQQRVFQNTGLEKGIVSGNLNIEKREFIRSLEYEIKLKMGAQEMTAWRIVEVLKVLSTYIKISPIHRIQNFILTDSTTNSKFWIKTNVVYSMLTILLS